MAHGCCSVFMINLIIPHQHILRRPINVTCSASIYRHGEGLLWKMLFLIPCNTMLDAVRIR